MNFEASEPKPLAPARVQEIYEQHVVALERFLLGVLRNEVTAADALQTTFATLLEKGHLIQQQESIKSWLFRVAFNEAMLCKRRVSIGRRHAEGVAWKSQSMAGADKGADPKLSQSVHHAILQEEIARVQEALKQLPEVQQTVVVKRIYEGLKFREIADELNVPLGTVLARMQAGLRKLRPILSPAENEPDGYQPNANQPGRNQSDEYNS